MIIKEISILLVGLVFILIGTLASRHYRWKKFQTYLPIALGFFLIYIVTVGPLSVSRQRITEITNIDSTKVESIIFQPSRNSGYEDLTIYRKDSLIVARSFINKLCDGLHQAKIEGGGSLKNPREACRVEIHFYNKNVLIFGVRKSRNLTWISIDSNGEDGWHYAKLNATEFGNLLTNNHQ